MADAESVQQGLVVLFDSTSMAGTDCWLPSDDQLTQWISATLSESKSDMLDTVDSPHDICMEVSVACVSDTQMRELNAQYRDKDRPTNVLSFPADMPMLPAEGDLRNATLVLGDIIICPDVLAIEALEQGKSVQHHWAHLVVHSALHLNGFDHIDENRAQTMESLEIQILSKLGITNPYLAVSAIKS